jgi:OOP family OmpA-OmpF porin
MKNRFVLLATLFLANALCAQTEVKDHPMVSRFPGSQVLEHKVVEFDEFQLPMGPIVDTDKFTKSQHLEGKVTRFKYSMPENRSSLEIERSYENALRRGGFEVLFTCSGKPCFGDKFHWGYTSGSWGTWCGNCAEPMKFLSAKLSRPSGDIYVSLVVVKDAYEGGTWLSVVEVKGMEAGLVKVDASAMAKDIAETGHASLYGIYFDSGKSVVRPESDPTLSEIAKLMASNPRLKLQVVGHTDNVGTFTDNLVLSKQRADAVLTALVQRYRVLAERLQAGGVGPMAPIATNKNEDGRGKNRRVELVER